MMRGFYSEFSDYVRNRHPHCVPLLTSLEQRRGGAQSDLETLLTDIQQILGVARGLAVLGREGQVVASDVQTATELRGYLDAFIVDRCERFNRDKAAREIGAMLALPSIQPLWVFSTNYDRVIEHACDAHGIRWSDGFETSTPSPVANWTNDFSGDVKIVKLHGSVNWYEDDPGGDLHRLDRGYSLPGYDFRLLRGTQRLRPLMIIPTLEKEALAAPYIGLSVQFTDVLKDARLLVIVGNSLRDRHIKAYIQHRIDRLHVLLVGPSASAMRDILRRPERTHALDAGFSEFLSFGKESLGYLLQVLGGLTDDVAVGVAVDRFCAKVTEDMADEKSIAADADVASAWAELSSSITPVRVAAVSRLGDHRYPPVIRKLYSILSADTSPYVRIAAVDSLLRLLGAAAVDGIGNALCSDPSIDVQLEAALALSQRDLVQIAQPWFERRQAGSGINATLAAILARAMVKEGSSIAGSSAVSGNHAAFFSSA